MTGYKWIYAILNSEGQLEDESGNLVLAEDIKFDDVPEAEEYCREHDLRITVTG
jgi:hypothetical protein